MRVRPVRRDSLNAASFASVPELAKKTAEPAGAPASSSSRSASSICGVVAKKLETCTSVAAWALTAATSAGCAWPSDVDRDAAEQVEVARAVGVPDVAALAVGEHARGVPKTPSRARS